MRVLKKRELIPAAGYRLTWITYFEAQIGNTVAQTEGSKSTSNL